MKRVEIEALIKGFLLFFLSMSTLISIVIYSTYTKEREGLDNKLLDTMRICSFDLQCQEFSINFSDKKFATHKLYKNRGITAYFPIPQSQKNLLSISLSEEKYQEKLAQIREEIFKEFLPVILVIILFSILFSLYTLSPLRQSLRLTEEFIKDILHDFNTPLSTLRLNSAMLKREIGENKKILRIEKSIESVLSLQENLRCYLFDHEMQQEQFRLYDLIHSTVESFSKTYSDINYHIDIPQKSTIKSNPKAFERIINNLLSNASKYNKKGGEVTISYRHHQLSITDTGQGIHDTNRIFDRFYKEQDRGIGVGLHIVKKLCDELQITIEVKSQVGIGSCFTLTLPPTQ